jgi:hypothetical protein
MKEVLHNATQAAAFYGRVLALGFDKPVLATIAPYKPPKTTPQVRYAHSIMWFIAKAKGADAEDVKIDAKREFGIITVSTSFITGQRNARLKSLADYTREEIESFITQLEHYCASENIEYIAAKED